LRDVDAQLVRVVESIDRGWIEHVARDDVELDLIVVFVPVHPTAAKSV